LYQHYKDDRVAQRKILERWKFIRSDCMGFAYMLAPKFAINGFFIDDEKFDFMSSFENFTSLKYPTIFQDVNNEFMKYVSEMSVLTGEKKNYFAKLSSAEYWNIFGKIAYPKLYTLSNAMNALVCSSASSERVWSIYKFVHTRLRNRLSTAKVDKLVFLYVNCGIYDKDQADYIFEDGSIISDTDFDAFE
jgi:hAT family C-terminal dimerisation region